MGYPSVVLTPQSRLGLVASRIAPDARCVLDVGYDHGKLLAHLAETRPELRLIGGEVLVDAPARFEATFGPQLAELRVGEGLSVVEPGEVDVVVCAGLTDRSILAILEAGRAHLPHLTQVICCPPALETDLRPGLTDLGLRIVDETVAFKRHRSYDVIVCAPGAPRNDSAMAAAWGPVLVERRDPLLARHLAIQRQLFRRDFQTEFRSHKLADGTLDPMGRKLAMLESLLAQTRSWGG